MGVIVISPGGSLDLPTIAKLLTPEMFVWERTPTTGIMRLVSKAKVARSFSSVVHSLEFGSVTLTLRINGSPIPGLSNLIPGTTPFRATATGGNILPVDGMLEVVLSRVSSAKGLSLQFEYDWIV